MTFLVGVLLQACLLAVPVGIAAAMALLWLEDDGSDC